jgi:hypothetical protein
METEKIAEFQVRMFELFAPYFTNPDELQEYCFELFKRMRLPV